MTHKRPTTEELAALAREIADYRYDAVEICALCGKAVDVHLDSLIYDRTGGTLRALWHLRCWSESGRG